MMSHFRVFWILVIFINYYLNLVHLQQSFVMQINGDVETAQQIAREYSMTLLHQLFSDENYYHFKRVGREVDSKEFLTLSMDDRVAWVKHQFKRSREIKRVKFEENRKHNVEKHSKEAKMVSNLIFNDPYYPDQWYLHNEGQTGGTAGNDLNVKPVWEAGFTGNGVTLSVLDDGIQHTNLEIQQNYEPSISYDMVDFYDLNHDPTPDMTKKDSYHGTFCAAIIAAVANNSFCGIGIAYNAKIGGLRVLDGKVTDLQEALTLSYGLDKVDIYSASWGPKDDGRHMSGPGPLAKRAFEKGIHFGRGGKGVIYVWAVGNGGLNSDNCNMDGYVSSIYTVAISALTESGLSTYYSEPCASSLASAYVGGLHSPRNLTNLIHDIRTIKIVVPKLNGQCFETFQGTSAAAPLAAGVIGLVLEVNPSLTWRDVQHLLVHTSRIPNYRETGWTINGAGHHFHLNYGFGVIDAALMAAKAQQWTLVSKQHQYTVTYNSLPRNLRCNQDLSLRLRVTITDVPITRLEHVMVTLSVRHPRRKHLELFLQSPSGTVSQLLTRRPLDNNRKGIKLWNFMSVHFWDENPEGEWTFIIKDSGGDCHLKHQVTGTLNHFAITFYGTLSSNLRLLRRIKDNAQVPDSKTVKIIAEMEKLHSRSVRIKKK